LWKKFQNLLEKKYQTTSCQQKLMHGPLSIANRNYRSLIIAGIGTIGKSLIRLGAEQLSLFEHIVAIDKNSSSLLPLQNSGITCLAGDISQAQFLSTLMHSVPGPALFVNLCSGTNNIMIRNHLARYHTAYLDSCASTTHDPDECRFSRLMPYTYTEINTQRPHWLCWGINPGLVEIIARRMLAGLPDLSGAYDVAVYEFDRLANDSEPERAAVGWCPEALVEEVMLAPTMEIINGRPQEDTKQGTRACTVNWANQAVPARIVGHEDIWNLTEIPAVKNGTFYYSLNPAVMDILAMNDPKKARSLLAIPAENDAITGLEQVAVQISGESLAGPQTLVWTEDHGTTWEQYGVNAVQYQTAKSLLLAIMLLQRTDYGLVPLSLNASNLPIASQDWPIFDEFMEKLTIKWQDGAHLNLQLVSQEVKG